MIAIPDMKKPKKGEVIAFDGECAVYTDDDMQVHRYLLIEIVQCKDCKHSKTCVYPAKWNWCPDGERRSDEHK